MRSGGVMSDKSLLGTWVRRFLLEHLVDHRGLSVNTQKSYRDMLMQLLPSLAKKTKVPVDRLTVEDASANSIRAYLQDIEVSRGCSVSTRNQRLAGIHALARFIGEQSPEHIQWCGQIRLIPFKKTDEPAITALDVDEMNALLATPDRSTAQGKRDYALLLFLYNSGARASEAAQLKISDIDWNSESVQILGKGKKRRICPLWKLTLSTIKPLLDERIQSESVFLNRTGQPMTRSGVHGLVKRLATRACVRKPSLKNKKIGPHVIRHTTATHLLRAGVDINTIRGWLGHVSVNTTNIYAEIDLETKARALAACSVAEKQGSVVPWREQKTLMAFLGSL